MSLNKDKFEMPDYYSTKKPKSEEILVKRKCFRCNKEKKMGKFERYCSDSCRSLATRYYTTPSSIVW